MPSGRCKLWSGNLQQRSCRRTTHGLAHAASKALYPSRACGCAGAQRLRPRRRARRPCPRRFGRSWRRRRPRARARRARRRRRRHRPACARGWAACSWSAMRPRSRRCAGWAAGLRSQLLRDFLAACALGPAAQQWVCCVTLPSVAIARHMQWGSPAHPALLSPRLLSKHNDCVSRSPAQRHLAVDSLRLSAVLRNGACAGGALLAARHGLRPDALCRAGRDRGCERRRTPCRTRAGLPPGATARGGCRPIPARAPRKSKSTWGHAQPHTLIPHLLARCAGAGRPGVPAPAQRRGPGKPRARMPRRAPPRARGRRRAARAATGKPSFRQ